MKKCCISEQRSRGNYSHRIIGRLALLMFVIGYGDVICFPHFFLKYGIAYLGPYLILYLLLGVPLFSLEVLIGQFQNLGPIKAFYNLAPILKGVGWGMAMSSSLCSIYFNMYVASCLVLFVRSVFLNLGYYDKKDVTTPLDDFMNPVNPNMAVENYDLFVAYILSWTIVILCILKEFQGSSKIIVFFNAIPFFLLFLIICLKIFGSANAVPVEDVMEEGKKSLIERLLDGRPPITDHDFWIVAFKHVIYDLGLGFGVLSTLASYNRITANCITDAFVIPLIGIGFGFGCLFLVYDHYEVSAKQVALLPVLKSYLFIFSNAAVCMIYLMSFIKGLGSLMTKIEMLITAFFDQFPTLREKYYMRVVAFGGFLAMLPGSLCLIPGIFEHIVRSSLTLNLFMAMILAFAGPFASRQYNFIKEKINLKTCKVVDWYLRACWIFVTPLVLLSSMGSMAAMKKFDTASLFAVIIVVVVLFFISINQISSMKMKDLIKPTREFCLGSERSSLYSSCDQRTIFNICADPFASWRRALDLDSLSSSSGFSEMDPEVDLDSRSHDSESSVTRF